MDDQSGHRALLAEAQAEIKLLRDELVIARRSCWETQRLADRLRTNANDAEAASNAWEKRAKAAETDANELASIKHDFGVLQETCDSLKRELENQIAARSVLSVEFQDGQTTIHALQRKLAEADEDRAHVQRKGDEQAAQVLLLKKQVLDLEEEVWLSTHA